MNTQVYLDEPKSTIFHSFIEEFGSKWTSIAQPETWGTRQHGGRWLAHQTPNAAALQTGGDQHQVGAHPADIRPITRTCSVAEAEGALGARQPKSRRHRDEDLVFPRAGH